MCGIAGYVGSDARGLKKKLGKMLDVQSHRGPDARGEAYFNNCALGHLRLSIIDLSDAGNQPFFSRDRRWAVVFNGEIYNYRELRQELREQGANFDTQSDTEVLLAAWQYWGENSLERFIGMFAFAIWDDKEEVLFCVRDRFGIKPFHYALGRNGFWFASEIKGLFAAGIDRRPNKQAWATYLTQAHYDHTASTFFDGVMRLLPGHLMKVSRDAAIEIKRYWNHPEPFSRVDGQKTYRDACEELRGLLLDTVGLHLRADVPCGLLLSGGVDSAVVLAAAHQAGHKDIRGFHYYFPEPYSELPWVEELVATYGSEIFYYELALSRVADVFNYYAWHFEEPFGSIVLLALGPLYIHGRRDGIRVFLDGNGADDVFGGYRQHQIAFLSDLKLSGQDQEFEKCLTEAATHWNEAKEHVAQQVDLLASDRQQHREIDMTLPVFSEAIAPSIKDMPALQSSQGEYNSLLARYIIKGLTQTKIPRNTRFDDHLSMAFSMEQRVPLLDHRLIEFVSTIPASYLFKRGYCKSIVRDAMRGLVPDKVAFAKKREVQSPQREWLGAPLSSFVTSILESESFAQRGFVDAGKARKYYQDYLKETPSNSFALWQWINMEVWHRLFIDSSLADLTQRPVFREEWL